VSSAEIMSEGDDVVVGAMGGVLIIVLTGPFTSAGLARIRKVHEDMAARGIRKVAAFAVVDPRMGTTTPAAIAEAREYMRKFRNEAVCVAVVVHGAATFQVFIKTVAAGVQLAVKQLFPWRVFGDDQMADAATWLAETATAASLTCHPEDVADAVAAVMKRKIDLTEIHSTPTKISGEDEDSATVRVKRDQTLPDQIGRFTIKESLGTGGMAEVFRAVATGPGGFEKELVVKTMHPHLASLAHYREMFLREARIAAQLPGHANVVQVFEAGEADGVTYIAMERVFGLTTVELARRAWAAGRDVPADVAAAIAADAARGLHHAHKNEPPLVHRDVSPDNVIVGRDGTAKLLDFGIARAAGDGEITASGVIKGKLPFMSPEQIGGKPLDGRSDLYALGCTLFFLLAKKKPIQGNTDADLIRRILLEPAPPLSSVANVPPKIAAIVDRLLSKSRDERYATGLDVAAALEAAAPTNRDRVAAFVAEISALPPAGSEPDLPPTAPTTDDSRIETSLRAPSPSPLASSSLASSRARSGLALFASSVALVAALVGALLAAHSCGAI
jgi:serine/threonine protein kinase